MSNDDSRVYSWFLGPKAENADVLERLVVDAIRDCVFWRRNFQPDDEILITEKIRAEQPFQDSISHLRQELLKMLANLKSDIPFYSPRYVGHMLGDQLLPAIAGYFAAMLHNPNNVTREASPITTEYEMDVARDLAALVGFENPGTATWGHITSGGTIANFEALWVARNLKYFPLAAKRVALRHCLGEIKVRPPWGGPIELQEADSWSLLNLPPDEVLALRDKLYKAYEETNGKEGKRLIDTELARDSISGEGLQGFFDSFRGEAEIKPGRVVIPATAHYSCIKVVEALGIGRNHIDYIPVDSEFRIDIPSLKERLKQCASQRIPVIAVVSVVGTTEEGAVDHVHEIIKLRKEFGTNKDFLAFWHHCDAAWGGYARSLFYDDSGRFVSDAGKIVGTGVIWPPNQVFQSFRAMEQADSVTIDSHKLGYIPYPCGVILFRDKRVKDLI